MLMKSLWMSLLSNLSAEMSLETLNKEKINKLEVANKQINTMILFSRVIILSNKNKVEYINKEAEIVKVIV